MIPAIELLDYSEVQRQLPSKTSHLLLGNGFSITCDSRFCYESLYDYVKSNGLPDRVVGVFDHVGTNNFEGVMRLLVDADWMADHYGLISEKSRVKNYMIEDLETLKNALVSAVAKTHPAQTNDISDESKTQCAQFLAPYHNVFTTNYDLLLYWVEMHSMNLLKGRDGFCSDPDDPDSDHVIFHEHVGHNKGFFYIHGALHLYVNHGEICKHTWTRTQKPLITSIRESLSLEQYPLFVAQGKSEQKLEQIHRSGYLSYCLGKLERIKNSLVVYGLSFGSSDDHISNVIAYNRELESLFVGMHGEIHDPKNIELVANVQKIVAKRNSLIRERMAKKKLTVQYYNSATANIWK